MVFFKGTFDKRDPLQNGSVKLSLNEVSLYANFSSKYYKMLIFFVIHFTVAQRHADVLIILYQAHTFQHLLYRGGRIRYNFCI